MTNQEDGKKGLAHCPPADKNFTGTGKAPKPTGAPSPPQTRKCPIIVPPNGLSNGLTGIIPNPFFLTVGFIRPHVPWYVPQKWFDQTPSGNLVTPPYRSDDRNDLPSIALRIDDLPMMPTTEWAIENDQWKNMVQAYLACIAFTDHCIGEILKTLEQSEYKDNTIVVLWSDNGYRLGEKGTFAKHCLWEEGTRVPLIIAVPGMKGLTCDEPVELLDLYPTLTDLCDLPPNKANEGSSLEPPDQESPGLFLPGCGQHLGPEQPRRDLEKLSLHPVRRSLGGTL
ncbi:MAG: sulfatase-like hydrolase/transferase [Mangrovibacterium sp.]